METLQNRDFIITELSKYFSIEELVSKAVYNIYGNSAWQFFHTDLLHCLLVLRIGIGKKMTINDWKWGGSAQQRGLRENISPICISKTNKGKLYLSGHVLGMAFDVIVDGMTATEVRAWIVENQIMFPCKIRLEELIKDTNKESPTFGEMIPTTWTHLDVKYEPKNPKVYLFNVG